MSRRRVRRRIGTYVALVAATVAIVAVIALRAPRSYDALRIASLATAWSAALALAATLSIGPLRALRGRGDPVHLDFRRDLGIFTAVCGLLHTGLGLQVHLRGRMIEYFFYPAERGGDLRLDAFGVANWTGAVAAVLALVLLGTSNDRSLRWLGTRRWKGVQRLAYGLFLLVAVHGLLYQLLERRRVAWVAAFAVALLAAGSLQALTLRGRQDELPSVRS